MFDKQLAREALIEKRLLGAVTVMGAVGGVIAVAHAYYLAKVVDDVFLKGSDFVAVSNLIGGLVALALLRAAVMYFEGLFASKLALSVETRLRERLVNHLLGLGPVALAREPAGELINILTEGVDNLEPYFTRYLPQLVKAAIIPCFILVVVSGLDLQSSLIMLVTAPIIPMFMVLIGKKAEKLNKEQWTTLNNLSAHFMDVLSGLTTLKLFGRSGEQAQTIAKVSREFQRATLDVLKIAFLSALSLELLTTLSTAIVAVTVGLRLLFGEVSFIQAFFVLLLAPEFYLPLRLLGSHFHAGIAGQTAAADIYRLLKITGAQASGGLISLTPTKSIIVEFDGVEAKYEEGKKTALSGLTFTVNPGEHLVIVGPSGAGKSTVAALLMGFLKPSDGIIRINGIDLNKIKRENWLENVAFLPQKAHLFQRTVRENIEMGSSNASMSAVIDAAKAAGAHEFISLLPKGYDTLVGESGRGLSGGERQRIALARAFLKDTGLVILDEAARGLDVKHQSELDAAMERLFTGRTVISIAHRLSTARQADKILVLSEGRVAEAGTHSELIAAGGLYYRLVTACSQEVAQ